MLRLHTFGGLRLQGPDGLISGPAARRRPLAVLAVIAAAGSRGITRERVVGVLWPEVPEDQGRHALAQVLYALRKDLGTPDLLDSGTPDLRLKAGSIHSDVGDFLDAMARRDHAAAIALYAGPFLDGVYLSQAPGFEAWVEEERGHLTAQLRRALELEAVRYELAGDLRLAANCWRRLVGLDPLATAPRLRLMRALAEAGEPAAALEEARVHAELTRRELGVAPAAEIATVETGDLVALRGLGARGRARREVQGPGATAIGVARREIARCIRMIEHLVRRRRISVGALVLTNLLGVGREHR